MADSRTIVRLTDTWSQRGFVVCILFSLAAACGGGSATTPVVETHPEVSNMTLGEMRGEMRSMVSDFTPITYTPLDHVPTNSTVSFEGYWTGVLANTNDNLTNSVMGQMTLEIDLERLETGVTGEVIGFRDASNRPMQGSLTFSDGNLDRSGDPQSDATLTFYADGSLIDSNGNLMTFDILHEGDLLGADYQGAGGAVFGTVIHSGNSQEITGSFIVGR